LVSVVDPFSDTEAIVIQSLYGFWSPSGESVCRPGSGHYDVASPLLYVHSAPGWQTRGLAEDHVPDLYRPSNFITTSWLDRFSNCAWLDENTLAVTERTFIDPDPDGIQLDLYVVNALTGALTRLARHAGTVSSLTDVVPIPTRGMFAFQARSNPPYTEGEDHPETPILFDWATGSQHTVLTEDDWVVAAVPASAMVDWVGP
jgi:hypothetical protein